MREPRTEPTTTRVIHGTTRVRDCCTFQWWRVERWWESTESRRHIEIESHHCRECVRVLRRVAENAIFQSARRPTIH
jgi:hypothetical protein